MYCAGVETRKNVWFTFLESKHYMKKGVVERRYYHENMKFS